jgi:dTMP kinase
LSDRFLDSSIAYQGGAGQLGPDRIRALHDFGSAGFLPDRTLLLELPPEAAATRARARDGGAGDRIGARSSAYHAAVAAAFAEIAAAEPDRVRRIDATGTAEEVTERLLAALADSPVRVRPAPIVTLNLFQGPSGHPHCPLRHGC